MARKLFSLESATKDDGDSGLLIDKVLKAKEVNKPGLTLTSELIKQRHQLKEEIQKEIANTDDSGGDGSESTDENPGTETSTEEPSNDDDGGDSGDENKSDEGEGSTQDKPSNPDGGEGDEVDAATDKEGLKGLVGSGLNSDGGDDAPKEPEKKEATESFKPKTTAPRDRLFSGVIKTHERYLLALEGMENLPAPAKPKQQPVVYVKEDVLKGLDELLSLSGTYVAKNNKKTQDIKEGLLKLAESLTIYREYIAAGKLKLTMKVVESEDILKVIAMPGSANIKATAATMDKYMGVLSGCFTKLASNDISTVKTVFTSSGFTEKEGVLVFDKILPGFNRINASVVAYVDYLSVDYEDYQIFNTKNFKVQDLYNIGGVTLEKEDDLSATVKSLDGVSVHVGLFMDNLSDLSKQYVYLMDKIKALHYDIKSDKVKNLAEVDVDSELKDFIKFKMLSEAYTICSDLCVEFLTSAASALSELVALDGQSVESTE